MEKHFELINSSKDASRTKATQYIQASQINYQKKMSISQTQY